MLLKASGCTSKSNYVQFNQIKWTFCVLLKFICSYKTLSHFALSLDVNSWQGRFFSCNGFSKNGFNKCLNAKTFGSKYKSKVSAKQQLSRFAFSASFKDFFHFLCSLRRVFHWLARPSSVALFLFKSEYFYLWVWKYLWQASKDSTIILFNLN